MNTEFQHRDVDPIHGSHANFKIASSTSMLISGTLVGLAGLFCGLYLELYVMKRDPDLLRGIESKGWALAVVGGILFCYFAYALVIQRDILTINASGIGSPRQRLSIPWRKVLGVRLVAAGRFTYLVVRLENWRDIRGATWSRWSQSTIRGLFAADEVPINLNTGAFDLDSLINALVSFVPTGVPIEVESLENP